jgi:hypothetical protein
MKRKIKSKHSQPDDEFAALVVGLGNSATPYVVEANLAPEARVPGINPVEKQGDLFPVQPNKPPHPRR